MVPAPLQVSSERLQLLQWVAVFALPPSVRTVNDGPTLTTFQTLTNDENEDDISTPHGGAIGNRAVSGRAFLRLWRKVIGHV